MLPYFINDVTSRYLYKYSYQQHTIDADTNSGMRSLQLLAVSLLFFFIFERQGHALVVDGVDLTHIRARCKNVTCVKPNCPYPIFDDNDECCLTCPPRRGLPLDPTLPPQPPPCGNSTEECPDTFCPVPIIRCDCCKTCKQDCRLVLCARAPCPNPIIPPGECCGQCETDCTLVDCAPLDCPVANQTHKPGACCPSCVESDVDSNDTDTPDASCPDHFCPNPVDCNGCKTCRMDCRAVTCVVPTCPNPVVAPGECCGTCERDCRTVRCARPLCVNPTYKPGACCPSCDDDICKYSGCVSNPGSNDTTWKPDQCTTCRCSSDGQSRSVGCVGTPCSYFNCSGRPLRTVPGNCCPTCDYGVSDKKCGVVPLEERDMSVQRGNRVINTTITIHQCDKPFIKRGNKIISCVPKFGRRKKKLPRDQRPHIRYRDVVKCKPVRWSTTCDLFVE